MGLFDEVRCHYPLPWPEVQEATWQSYDTPAQYLDRYEIREDGTLRHLAHTKRFEVVPGDSGGFTLHRDDEHWEPIAFDGALEIHCWQDPIMYLVRFWFRHGRVRDAIFQKEGVATCQDKLSLSD